MKRVTNCEMRGIGGRGRQRWNMSEESAIFAPNSFGSNERAAAGTLFAMLTIKADYFR